MNLVVSLHDVHPSSLAAVERQRRELRAVGVRRLSLLVVPLWHGAEPIQSDAEFLGALRAWREDGDEIVLHGWTHSLHGLEERPSQWFWTRLYTSREAEFLVAGPDETRARLATGRALLESVGLPPVGFIAPAWLMAPHTPDLLRDLGFAYTTTRTEVIPLARGVRPLHAPSLCYSTRSGWRRVSSRLWNPALARSQRGRRLLRISIHPSDIAYPAVWRQLLRLSSAALRAGRVPRTYGDFAVPGSIR